MKLTSSILFSIVVAAAASPAMAAGPYPISAGQVAAEISRIGMPVRPGKITMLAEVTATTQNPVLKVRSIQPQGKGEVLVRLECEGAGECLPFFVRVQTTSGSALTDRVNIPNRMAVSSRNPSAQAPLLKSGAAATLLLEGAHVHITIPVISLQNGVPGQTIRVTSADHRRTYSAQVVNANLLRGQL
jgi:hypothetical protein